MPSAGRRDFPLRRVTLGSGQGALGTWRAAHHLEALPDTWCQIPVRSTAPPGASAPAAPWPVPA